MRILVISSWLLAMIAVPVWSQVPRTADGHPDLNGFWKGTRDTKPVGNIAKDLPGLKLPLTPAGEAAWKHNTTATVDPEALCILGRHSAPQCERSAVHGSTDPAVCRNSVFL